MTRPTSHSHLTKRPAVARATAGKVLAGGCARQGQSGLSSPSMRGSPQPPGYLVGPPDRAPPPAGKDGATCVLLDRAGLELRGWPAPARHTRLRMTEGLRRARARLRQPAYKYMVILRPLLGVSDPWYQISFLALGRRSTPARAAAAWSKRYDPLSSARVRECRWTGQPRLSNRASEPPPDEHGPTAQSG